MIARTLSAAATVVLGAFVVAYGLNVSEPYPTIVVRVFSQPLARAAWYACLYAMANVPDVYPTLPAMAVVASGLLHVDVMNLASSEENHDDDDSAFL